VTGKGGLHLGERLCITSGKRRKKTCLSGEGDERWGGGDWTRELKRSMDHRGCCKCVRGRLCCERERRGEITWGSRSLNKKGKERSEVGHPGPA